MYAPETTVTKRIMDKLKSAFDVVRDLYMLFNTLSTTVLPDLKLSLVPDSTRLRLLQVNKMLRCDVDHNTVDPLQVPGIK